MSQEVAAVADSDALSAEDMAQISEVTGGVIAEAPPPAPSVEVQTEEAPAVVQEVEKEPEIEKPRSKYDEQIADRTAKLIEADNAIKKQQKELDRARQELDPVVKLASLASKAQESGDFLGALRALFPDKSDDELVYSIVDKYEGPKTLTAADVEAIAEKKAEAKYKALKEAEAAEVESRKKAGEDTYNAEADKYINIVDSEFRSNRDKYPFIVPGNPRMQLTRNECLDIVSDYHKKTGGIPSHTELLSIANANREKEIGAAGFARVARKQPIPGTISAVTVGTGGTNGQVSPKSHADEMEDYIANLHKQFSA